MEIEREKLESERAPKCRPRHRRSLIRNWTTHNLVSHPLSEFAWWVMLPFGRSRAERVSNWIHDVSVPEHDYRSMVAECDEDGAGRG
jgi:hypothetical protein